jgi:hypothetical protein
LRSFEQHERSHADAVFRAKFGALAEQCTETREFGYELLWQGAWETPDAQIQTATSATSA